MKNTAAASPRLRAAGHFNAPGKWQAETDPPPQRNIVAITDIGNEASGKKWSSGARLDEFIALHNDVDAIFRET